MPPVTFLTVLKPLETKNCAVDNQQHSSTWQQKLPLSDHVEARNHNGAMEQVPC